MKICDLNTKIVREISSNTMNQYKRKELEEALQVISSIISQCEKAQIKFIEGTSHHTRLNNK